MTVGVAAKAAYNYGWQTYNWSTYYPPVDSNLAWGAWNSFSAGPDADPTAIAGSGKINYNGYITVVWGERPGAYTGRMVVPIWTTAGATFNYRITGLKRKTQYYVNAYANIPSIVVVGGIPQSGVRQYGEVTYTTT